MSTRAATLVVLLTLLPLASGASDVRVEWYRQGGHTHEGDYACLTTPGGPTACLQQADGGVPGDASNSCAAPYPTIVGAATGVLVPPTDLEDNYALQVLAAGTPVTVTIATHLGQDPASQGVIHVVDVWAPVVSPCATYVGSATPSSPLVFTPAVAGTHTLRVQAVSSNALLGEGPGTRNCHVMCAITNATGYDLGVGG